MPAMYKRLVLAIFFFQIKILEQVQKKGKRMRRSADHAQEMTIPYFHCDPLPIRKVIFLYV